MARFRVRPSRTLLVAIWLVAAIQFLWWMQPGFWRSPYLKYEQARMLASENRNAEAIVELERAITEDPDNSGYTTYKGYLELVEQRYSAAEASFSRAVSLEAGNLEARLGLGEALVRQGRADEGLRALNALDGQPLDVDQRLRRRVLHALAGDFTGALGDTSLLEAEVTDWIRLRDGLRWAMAAGQWERALILSDRVLGATDDPRARADVMNERAVALRSLGRPDEALALFEQTPTSENLAARAELNLELERYREAARLFGDLVGQESSNGDLLRQQAYALEQSGQREAAVAAYRRVLAVDDPPATRIQLVTLLNTLVRYAEAWDTLSPLPRPATNAGLLRLQATTAFWAGHLTDADELFARLHSPSPADRAVENDLGYELAQRGDVERAETVYRRLLAGGDDPIARLRLTDLLNRQRRYADAWAVVRVLDADGAGTDGDAIVRLQAFTAFWAGDYVEAIPRFRTYLDRAPRDVDAWRDLAEAARQLDDETTEEAALAEYIPLQPADVAARERHASLLESQGHLDAAIREYRAALELRPSASTARTLAYLEQGQGLTDESIGHYTHAWDLAPVKNPAVALSIARLLRGDGRAREALAWHERYRQYADPDQRRATAVEAAWTALEAGDPGQALALVDEFAGLDTASDAELVVAARAAGDAGDPKAGAEHLEQLSQKRPLDSAEQFWLAGLYRQSGDALSALQQIEALAARPGSEPSLLEAIGDLRWELRDFSGAMEAYRTARTASPSPVLTLKIARLTAAHGQYDAALREYETYLKTETADGLRIEIGRVSLGAGAWADAERWAREASASGERGYEADMTLAEALHLQGRTVESMEAFGELSVDLAGDNRALETYGLLSAARNQHLRAIRTFQEAIDGGSTKPGELWHWSGLSALKRHDFASAAAALDKADASGELPALVQSTRERLHRESPATVTLPARIFGDSNSLSLRQAGARGNVWPSLRVPLFGEVIAGEVLQHDAQFTRQRAVIGTTDAFVAAALALDVEVGAERYEGGSLFVGRGKATFLREDTSFVSLDVHRETFWSSHDARDPRQFNRVIDLAGLGPDMTVTGLTGTADIVLAPDRRLLVAGGADRYGDENTRGFAYAQYEVVRTARQDRWTAFAPNLYLESYRQDSPFYFSPSSYVALGGLWHSIHTTPAWRLELETNPAATWSQLDFGFALRGVVDVARTWDRVTLGGGASFSYDQRERYGSYRLVGQLDLRLGE